MGIDKNKLRATLDREIAEAETILAALKRSRQTLKGPYKPEPGSLAEKAYGAIKSFGPINGGQLASILKIEDPSSRAVLKYLFERCAIQRTGIKLHNGISQRPSYNYFV